MQHVNEFELPFRQGNSGAKYLLRGPQLDWGVILLKPGERLAPHYHQQVEETFFCLRGKGKIFVDGKAMSLIPGDVYRLEPQEKHEFINDGQEDLKLVFIKTPYLPDDKIDA